MICKIGNLDVTGCLENRGDGTAFVQKTLNWHEFCGGGCSSEQYCFGPLKNSLDSFLFSGRRIAMTEVFVLWNCFHHFN